MIAQRTPQKCAHKNRVGPHLHRWAKWQLLRQTLRTLLQRISFVKQGIHMHLALVIHPCKLFVPRNQTCHHVLQLTLSCKDKLKTKLNEWIYIIYIQSSLYFSHILFSKLDTINLLVIKASRSTDWWEYVALMVSSLHGLLSPTLGQALDFSTNNIVGHGARSWLVRSWLLGR